MRFMNEWDIDNALRNWAGHPVLEPAAQTLSNLRDAVNENSDGWPYWGKPLRAAAKLMELIEGDGTSAYRYGPREDATPEKYKAALIPIKSFRTREGAKHGFFFKIVELP